MAEPYSETIISSVITALEGITVQSGDNVTVAKVVRLDRFSGDEGERPSIVVSRVGETFSRIGDEWQVSLTIRLQLRIELDDDNLVPTDRQISIFEHDVKRAISNLDFTTVIGDLESIDSLAFEDDEPVIGVDLDARFSYTVDYDTIESALVPKSGV